MKYKALIFDLDGTLTDPKTGITSCVQYALQKAGIPADDLSELLPYIGPPLRRSFRALHGLSDEQAQQAVCRTEAVPKKETSSAMHCGQTSFFLLKP